MLGLQEGTLDVDEVEICVFCALGLHCSQHLAHILSHWYSCQVCQMAEHKLRVDCLCVVQGS